MPVGRHHGARGFASYVVFACAVVCGTDGGVVVIVLSGGPPWKLVSIESNRIELVKIVELQPYAVILENYFSNRFPR
jgi:hypothetical protein